MEYIQVFKCLCDVQRLRILNLLQEGPLCVCHLIELLECDQVKVSKQLQYMKKLGMVESERVAQWRVYRLADPDHPLLKENLKCLQDLRQEELNFPRDSKNRKALMRRIEKDIPPCAQTMFGTKSSAC